MEEVLQTEKDDAASRERERVQYEKMTKTPIPKLIVSLGIPTMLNMMVTSLYNMADTLFVSGLGDAATGALNVAFPLMSIMQAVGFMFGHGSGNHISRVLGAGDTEDAQRMAAALEWLVHAAQERQILLFTCHTREAALLGGENYTHIKL